MQHEEGMRLRKQWGSKPCNHPDIASEFYLGTRTGEYLCTTCGKEFSSRAEWEKEQNRSNQSE